VVLSLALLFHFLANKTPFGRHVYAIGGNSEAAHLSGINLSRNILVEEREWVRGGIKEMMAWR